MPDTLTLAWKDVDFMVDELHRQIIRSYPTPENFRVIGITKGGVIPALLLAKRLNCKFDIIKPEQMPNWDTSEITILVDDISDSGKTLGQLLAWKTESFVVCIATLHTRHSSKCIPDWTATTILDDTWIIYPWENGVEASN